MAAILMQPAAGKGSAILNRRLTLDAATGTPNRSFLYKRLQAKLAAIKTATKHFAVAVFRIEGLNSLWKQAGEESGARPIEITRRIERECRVWHIVARIGNDELAVMLLVAARRSFVMSQMHRISQAISSAPSTVPHSTESHMILRAGSAVFPHDGRYAAMLMQSARTATGSDQFSVELRVQLWNWMIISVQHS